MHQCNFQLLNGFSNEENNLMDKMVLKPTITFRLHTHWLIFRIHLHSYFVNVPMPISVLRQLYYIEFYEKQFKNVISAYMKRFFFPFTKSQFQFRKKTASNNSMWSSSQVNRERKEKCRKLVSSQERYALLVKTFGKEKELQQNIAKTYFLAFLPKKEYSNNLY